MRNANSFCPLCKLPTFKRQLQRNPIIQNLVNSFQKLQGLITDGKVSCKENWFSSSKNITPVKPSIPKPQNTNENGKSDVVSISTPT